MRNAYIGTGAIVAYAECVSQAHDLNVIGAFALTTADKLQDNAAHVSQADGAAAAALGALAHHTEGETIASLAASLRVSHSRAVRIADALERDGLARRVPERDDRRAVRLRLTRKGKRLASRMQSARIALLDDALASLSARERAELARLAEKVLENVTQGRDHARATCRLCDAVACGHFEGRCPVTIGASAHEAARLAAAS